MQELAASICEISNQDKMNAAHASNANYMASKAASAIHINNAHMQKPMEAMGISNAKSTEINKIIKTIGDIEFQTNIFALNAAVEAARAGATGKEFAVVVD